MSSESLAGLHQAMNTLDQLKTSITKQAARLAFELTNASELVKDQKQKQILDVLGKSIAEAYERFWDAYSYAGTVTKILDYYVEHPEERETLEKQGLKLDKQKIKDMIIDFSVQIDEAASEIDLYIDTYKNMLGGESVKEIDNYTMTLRRFRGALLMFGGEVNKILLGL
ncbi:MAG: hypothetical protein QXU98_14670 [Candidatus Parvarchaeota archaeon]